MDEELVKGTTDVTEVILNITYLPTEVKPRIKLLHIIILGKQGSCCYYSVE